ncbi:sensor histidine kinase [Paenibacillus eucommiae]|uniref:Sensor histidine kinase YesM n=1 Tax=Paenibacillus eucommiae TaxID=1355755 RepID=A0ABS4IM71_9BACL|nr:histidine kinase [Paenibacillus eucommiae]MBP1988665.1 sensor histidine kinase YesM [Paenibacillus eucommiae]
MLAGLYKRYLGRFIFRKLNVVIGLTLLAVFISLGLLTYNKFYQLLERREVELLNTNTEKLELNLLDIVDRFKRETISIYKDTVVGQTVETNQYFLPGNIPSEGNEQQKLLEKRYFSTVLSLMLSRNPKADAFLFYRVQDQKLFLQSGPKQLQVDDSFNLPLFFSSFPQNYENPYLGQAGGLFQPTANAEETLIYFANPVFDLKSIRPDQVYGYYLMILDMKSLSDAVLAKQDTKSMLTIKHQGKLLFESDPQGERDKDSKGSSPYIEHTISLKQSGLEITGSKSKSDIQAKLGDIAVYIILILGFSWVICFVAIYSIQNIIVKRLKLMTRHFKKVQINPFTEPIQVQGEDEINDLMIGFNRMTSELQQFINRVYVADIQKRDAEFTAMKMQVHPHFLYNTLESLRMQAVIGDQNLLAEKLYRLGILFRWMLRTADDVIPIQEELQYTEYFLDLLMLGKSNRIAIQVESELDLSHCHMLKFSFQPIIENAIQHGELEKQEQPVIALHIARQADVLVIELSNNGQPINKEARKQLQEKLEHPDYLPQEHLGLKNLHERIKNYCGSEYGLFLAPVRENHDFGVVIKLPFEMLKGVSGR